MSNAQAATGSPRCSAMPRGWCRVVAAPSSCVSLEVGSVVSLKAALLEESLADLFVRRKLKMSLYPIFQSLSPVHDQQAGGSHMAMFSQRQQRKEHQV
ncbi:hypothetical protein ANANG_G00086240 [Anguilla anguilla]|uniref:Uncharacterized protein n=1 Tax=Anguilla anguilla TaxID=7936 RepID=A0A0E9WQP5_ANGAN|nr:hypothetical protein ANANG_G00086240 [Anguilla anguilla]